MRIYLALPMLLATGLLAACTSLQPDPGAAGRAGAAAGVCQADAVAWAVGQPANEEVLARVWRESGAGLVRPIAPGQAVTRDFRRDRLNIHIDRSNVITAIDCG